jgi:hypothetical protein
VRSSIGERGLLSDDKRVIALFKEGGRQYRADNPGRKRILRYRVDGEMIERGERCDFLLGLPRQSHVYLIELKGTNLKKAARQILATLDALHDRIERYVPHGRVVLRRIQRPDLRSADVIALERKLAVLGGSFRRECNVLVESV